MYYEAPRQRIIEIHCHVHDNCVATRTVSAAKGWANRAKGRPCGYAAAFLGCALDFTCKKSHMQFKPSKLTRMNYRTMMRVAQDGWAELEAKERKQYSHEDDSEPSDCH